MPVQLIQHYHAKVEKLIRQQVKQTIAAGKERIENDKENRTGPTNTRSDVGRADIGWVRDAAGRLCGGVAHARSSGHHGGHHLLACPIDAGVRSGGRHGHAWPTDVDTDACPIDTDACPTDAGTNVCPTDAETGAEDVRHYG